MSKNLFEGTNLSNKDVSESARLPISAAMFEDERLGRRVKKALTTKEGVATKQSTEAGFVCFRHETSDDKPKPMEKLPPEEKKPEKPVDPEEAAKLELGRLIDRKRKDREFKALFDDQLKAAKSAELTEWLRQDRELETLAKKDSEFSRTLSIGRPTGILKHDFPLLEYSANAIASGKERGKQWEAYCKVAAKCTSDGNLKKKISADAVQTGGSIFRPNELRAWDKPSGLIGTADEDDAKRTWGELHARLLQDISKPGNEGREFTAYCVCQSLARTTLVTKDESLVTLVDAVKQLTKKDKNGAPLTEEQATLSMRMTLKRFVELPHYLKPSELPTNLQLALIAELRERGDIGSVPLFQALLKSPHASVRNACARALSDFGPFPSKIWPDTIPDPRLNPTSRANMVKAAFDQDEKDRREYERLGIDSIRDALRIGTPVAEAIADAYRMPKGIAPIDDNKDPGLEQLDRAFNSKHLSVRLAATKVLSESKLDLGHPVRQKAVEVLVDTILDNDIGVKASKEAIALLDEFMKGHKFLNAGKYKLVKTKDGLIVEDSNHLYAWTDECKIETKDRETKYRVGDKFATVKLGANTTAVKYAEGGSRILSRTATFDGDDLNKLQWQEEGKKGPVQFLVRRKMEDGQYLDRWVVTVPNEKSGLTDDIEVEGKFELGKDGTYRYVGQDWVNRDLARKLRQVQEVTGKGVKEYRD